MILVCVLYIPVIVWAAYAADRNRRARKVHTAEVGRYTLCASQRRRGVYAGSTLLAAGIVFSLFSYKANRDFAYNKHIFPANVVRNMGWSVERWFKSRQYLSAVRDFSFGTVRERESGERQIYVLVIGEASRAHSWSLYGYERETTPRLDTMANLVFMRDVFTQSNTTHKSVPLILSAAAAYTYDEIYRVKGITALFSEAGYRTAFITNQPPNRSLTDHLTAEADTVIYATPRTHTSVQQYDGEVLVHLDSIINSTDEDMFVVIHTYGSHARHIKRYPREFARFLPDEAAKISPENRLALLNAYDNTIYYTDYVLSEIISLLDRAKARSAMLYISDHGEDLFDDGRNRFLHASPTKTYYQLHVPALIWFSPEYKDRFPALPDIAASNAARAGSTAEAFHTLADIAGLQSPGYVDRARSWVSGSFSPAERLYVNDYDIPVNIMGTGLSPEDITVMEQKGLTFDKDSYRREKF